MFSKATRYPAILATTSLLLTLSLARPNPSNRLSITIEIPTLNGDNQPINYNPTTSDKHNIRIDESEYPDDLLYTTTHMWTTKHTIEHSRPFGITAFAAKSYGELTQLGVPLEHGDEIGPGTTIAVLGYKSEIPLFRHVTASADGFVWTRNATGVEEVTADCYGKGALGTWLTADDLAMDMLNRTMYLRHLRWVVGVAGMMMEL